MILPSKWRFRGTPVIFDSVLHGISDGVPHNIDHKIKRNKWSVLNLGYRKRTLNNKLSRHLTMTMNATVSGELRVDFTSTFLRNIAGKRSPGDGMKHHPNRRQPSFDIDSNKTDTSKEYKLFEYIIKSSLTPPQKKNQVWHVKAGKRFRLCLFFKMHKWGFTQFLGLIAPVWVL